MVKKSILYTRVLIFVLLCLWVPSECYSEGGKKKPEIDVVLVQQLKDLDLKIEKIEKRFYAIDAEIGAAKKLLEISEKNLSAPNWMFGVIIGIAVGISGILGFVGNLVRKHIISEINDAGSEYEERINSMISDMQELKMDQHQLFAISYNTLSVEAWKGKRIYQAIKYGEYCLKYAELVWGLDSKDPDVKRKLAKRKSNLAYMYAEKRLKSKTGVAIEYAKEGLEVGKAINELDLIDNYLFTISQFPQEDDEKKQWLHTFEIYKDEIYKDIRKKEKERQVFDMYYKKTKKELCL